MAPRVTYTPLFGLPTLDHGEADLKVGIRFGDWLVRRGLISRVELFEALSISFNQSIRLGDALVSSRVLPRAVVEAEATHHQAFVVKAAHTRTIQFPLSEA